MQSKKQGNKKFNFFYKNQLNALGKIKKLY